MKNNRIKRTMLVLCIFFVVGILGCMALVVVYDPFFQYHKPLQAFHYTIDNQTSQNPGIAKQFEYDSIILGSSMTINFNTDYFDELMGIKTVKLSYNGAYPKDHANILPIVQKTHPDLKNVFWGIDIHNYTEAEEIQAYETPDYLYDDFVWNDFPYLLNKEVLLNYIILPHENTTMSDAYSFWRYTEFSEKAALKNYVVPQLTLMLDDNIYIGAIQKNMDQYVIPYIEEMTDTEFVFFFPPYSILYWDSQYRSGNMDAFLNGEKYIMRKLLQYPNTKVFFFQDDWDIVLNLNYYSDYYHYSNEINDYMTKCFAEGMKEVMEEDLEQVMNSMREFLLQSCPLELPQEMEQ